MTDEHAHEDEQTDKMIDALEYIAPHSSLTIQHQGFKSKMSIEHDAITIYSRRDYPNAWHRFWYRVLLGWKWSRLADEQASTD